MDKYLENKAMPFMQQDKAGAWRLEGDKLPLVFSLKANKPLV